MECPTLSCEICIAIRQSVFALWQVEYVKARLEWAHPGLTVTLPLMISRGDKLFDTSLVKIGGRGLFVKRPKTALLESAADIAVHSMKDMPTNFPEGLGLYIICEREDPRDVFVSNAHASLEQLPAGSAVGTSSLRRQAQLLARWPDLQIRFLRGNINTRLVKLDAGEYDAIIPAAADLIRLGSESCTCSPIGTNDSLSVGGQGAVGIGCRTADSALHVLLEPLHRIDTTLRVTAEHVLNERLNGGCQVSITCYAIREGDQLWLCGLVDQPDDTQPLCAGGWVPLVEAEALDARVAEDLLKQGVEAILEAVYGEVGYP